MANSWQSETATAGQVTVNVNIKYLAKTDIYLYIDQVETAYNWDSDTVLRLRTALTGGEEVLIVRRTAKNTLRVNFSEGAAFSRDNLDEQNLQFLYAAQELVEGRSFDGFYGDLSMNGFRITALGAPAASSDAANKNYVDTEVSTEAGYRTAADTSLQSQITGGTPVLSAERSVISWHGQSLDNSVLIPANSNAMSIGPVVTIEPGQTVTIGDNAFWSVFGDVFEISKLHELVVDSMTTSDGTRTAQVESLLESSDVGTLAKQDSDEVEITGGTISGVSIQDVNIAVSDGGTGARTAAAARSNLAAAAAGANSDITSLAGLTTPLSRAQGGTGQSGVSYLRAESTKGGTAVASGAFTMLTPTKVIDTRSSYNSGVWTVPDTGYYQICGFVRFVVGSGTGYTRSLLCFADTATPPTSYVDGATVGDYTYANTALGEVILNLSCVLYLTAGVNYALYAFQNGGSSVTTTKEALQIIRVV